jgi:hypothetical protein
MAEQASAFEQPSEGFRGVRWCTRRGDIPWEWSTSGFGAPCAQRANEVLDVFGINAAELTYTFRNSLLYGVRIDVAAKDPCGAVDGFFSGPSGTLRAAAVEERTG